MTSSKTLWDADQNFAYLCPMLCVKWGAHQVLKMQTIITLSLLNQLSTQYHNFFNFCTAQSRNSYKPILFDSIKTHLICWSPDIMTRFLSLVASTNDYTVVQNVVRKQFLLLKLIHSWVTLFILQRSQKDKIIQEKVIKDNMEFESILHLMLSILV